MAVLAGGLILDGTGNAPFRADVRVERDRIVEIGEKLDGDEIVDVAGATIMPGLIDCHTHVAYPDVPKLEEAIARSPSYRAFRSITPLRETLAAGITTVRDAGGADAGMRRAVEEGLIIGPRLLVSLMQLSPTAGPYDLRTPSGLDLWSDRPDIPRPVADGVDGVRAKVREFVHAGADVIKIFATGHFAMPRGGAHRQLFGDDELRAITGEALALGVRVMGHAHGATGVAAAARAGVASIEHGIFIDETAIAAMLEHKTILVPTLLASVGMAAGAEQPEDAERAAAIVETHRAAVRTAHQRGVRIAFGTDCPMTGHGNNLDELVELSRCGLTPSEALVAATGTAADLIGLGDEIGRIQPGKRADTVIVSGDALELEGLRDRIRGVYRNGVPVVPGQ